MRTPRGREVTDKAYKHLGKLNTNIQGGFSNTRVIPAIRCNLSAR
jgi:hypothetical protein